VWPARALPPVLRALGGVPRLVLRFWEHYEVGHAFQTTTFRLHQQPCIAILRAAPHAALQRPCLNEVILLNEVWWL